MCKINNNTPILNIEKPKGWGCRHQQCFILFLCLTITYAMKSCLGVALVDMVENDSNKLLTLNVHGNETDNFQNYNILHSLLLIPPYPKFNWNKKVQDTLLSSLFWGYTLLQIPSGQLAHFFGARFMLTSSLAINCIVSFSLPWATYYGGWILMLIFRVIQGLSQSCLLPSMHTMLGKWTHLEERGRLAGLTYSGVALGTVLGLPLSGFIAASPLGWPGVFRFYGIVSGVAAVLLWHFIADSPAKHENIFIEEKVYIENNVGISGKGKKQPPVPWGKIFRCRGMYAIVIAHIGQTWGHLTMYTELPAYMDKIMGVNIKANGLLTALPFLIMWLTNFFFSWLTDILIIKKVSSVANVRKLMNSLGSIPPAIGLVLLAYAPKNIYIVESLLIFICGFKTATQVGFNVNHIDISNNYSGTMMSISTFVSSCIGSVAPLMAGFILTDVTSELLWRKVFFLAAAIYFLTNAVYVIFGTAERAEWDYIDHETSNSNDDHEEMVTMIKRT